MTGLCRNVLEFLKLDFRLAFKSSLPLTLIYLTLIPCIRGISNLNPALASQCLSQSAALIGVLLLVPVAQQELNPGIKEIICTKEQPYLKTVAIRLICGFVLLSCLIAAFASLMRLRRCAFPFGEFVLAAILYAGFLGMLGLAASQLGRSVIPGYLSSLGYWTLCRLQIIREGDAFYVFPVIAGHLEIRRLLLLGLIVAILTGITCRRACRL